MADETYDFADDPKPATQQRVVHTSVPVFTKPRYQPPPDSGGKKIAGFVALAIVVIASAVGMVLLSGKMKQKPKGPMLADDAYVESQLDDGATGDVEEWLDKSNRRMVMGMTNSQAKGQAESWKRMGAKRVVAFGAAVTLSLAIELPSDPKERKQLFDWENEHHWDFRKPPAKDIGQRWLLIMMHP